MSIRVWYLADGRVAWQQFHMPEHRERDIGIFQDQYPVASFEDMTVEEFEAMRPKHPDGRPDNSEDFRWRKNPNGRGFIIDKSVPPPPHKYQAVVDAVEQATTMDELKDVLRRYITR